VLFLYLMHFVFNWVASTIGFGLVYDLPGAWFLTMLQLSILTTLYSHFAKGRELS